MSSIVTLGCYAFSKVSQVEADQLIELALSYGVNHFDVAPSYGEAERRLRHWLRKEEMRFFLPAKPSKERKKVQKKSYS